MTGAIWLVQILVYPNFRLIDPAIFPEFHRFHTNRITWVVAPAMGIELATGAWLCLADPGALYFWNLSSILAAWALKGLVSVPIHNHLEKHPAASKDGIIWTNWPRTVIWTLRSGFWLWILHRPFPLKAPFS
jgi:hypothetical protein